MSILFNDSSCVSFGRHSSLLTILWACHCELGIYLLVLDVIDWSRVALSTLWGKVLIYSVTLLLCSISSSPIEYIFAHRVIGCPRLELLRLIQVYRVAFKTVSFIDWVVAVMNVTALCIFFVYLDWFRHWWSHRFIVVVKSILTSSLLSPRCFCVCSACTCPCCRRTHTLFNPGHLGEVCHHRPFFLLILHFIHVVEPIIASLFELLDTLF